MDLEREIEEINNLDARASEAKDERGAKIDALKKKIISGEGSTGDPIKDFLFITHGNFSEEDEKPYRELEKMLKDREGEQVLVVNEEVNIYHGGGCFGGHGSKEVESTLRLGVLTSDIIFELGNGESDIISLFSNDYTNLQGPRIIIPTKKHVKRNHGLEWQLIEKNIEIPSFDLGNLDVNGKRTYSIGWNRDHHLAPDSTEYRSIIKIGGEEVLKGFKSQIGFFEDDLSYVEAARLLGIGNQVPEEFVKAYDQKIYDEKLRIIKNLKELTETEKGLVIKTDYSKFRGDRELVDEVAFKLNAPFGKLKETRRQIKRNLEYAIKERMGNEEWILEGDITGETLDVPVYISKLCENYEVPISK